MRCYMACPSCGTERADAEVTADGWQFLDTCPNCGSEEEPELVGEA